MEKRLIPVVSITVVALLIMVFAYYQQGTRKKQFFPSEEDTVGLTLNSPAFEDNDGIPRRYTCDGEDVSPPLSWNGVPKDTKFFTLIVDDPDASKGAFTHWVIFNLPVDVESLPERLPKQKMLDNGGVQGQNDFGDIGYGGPCPPPGKSHRYRFHLYALDTELSLESGASKQDVLKAMEGHVLDESEIIGTYGR